MVKSLKKLVSVITTVVVVSVLVLTSLPAIEAKAITTGAAIGDQIVSNVAGNNVQAAKRIEGVYFKKPAGWGIPTCYVYDDSTSTVKKNASWPGVQMIYDGENGYYYKIPEGFTNPKVMFASGNKQFPGSNQAGHVYTPGTALICDGTSWKEVKIVKPVPATIGISQEGGIFKTESLELTLSLQNALSATYSINDGTEIAYTNGQKIVIGASTINNNNVTVKLKAIGETGIVEKTYTFTKKEEIISDPLIMPEVQISPEGPHYVGLDIKISLDKEFKTAYKYYKFEVGSNVISDFSEAKETNWTPFKSGAYEVKITGKDEKGNTSTVFKDITIESDNIMDYVDITSVGPSVKIKLKNVVITPELINQIKSSKYYGQIISSEEYAQFKLAVKAKLITISYSDMSITVNQVKIGNYFIPIPVFDEEGNLSKELIPVVINYTVPK